ncbi:hypothetical protein GQS52_06920 [Streptomyces sp. SCUT-3]|uniref:hypothetical protein n=1 Tax=Streptomyces sp. SCUT-3 TaxID=2684469 RepID=UPI000CC772BA|nr:hypothetical protein [Streptomyces sp. SCUT-3]PLW71806.1 hypothetical protein C0036_15915 [Streptomyces sp. DJ]QMV21552.1 hypothetical protein GQS52_06920 [Streptomyces sp. SCUT-3]
MADQYKVDLDELDEVVRSINKVLRAMEQTKGKTAHQTYLPDGALGKDFTEARELKQAHDNMKSWLEGLTDVLTQMIDEYEHKTTKVMGNYQDAEYQHTSTFNFK